MDRELESLKEQLYIQRMELTGQANKQLHEIHSQVQYQLSEMKLFAEHLTGTDKRFMLHYIDKIEKATKVSFLE